MPLTRADKEQVDNYLKSNQPHLAKLILQDHLKEEPFDETARKVLDKINTRYPATSTPPAFSMPSPTPARKLQSDVALPKITPKPTPTSITASDDGDIDAIKQAIREKRYDDAEALLVLSDHPEADKLRERLSALRGGGEKSKRVVVEQEQDFTGRLAVTVFLLIFLFLPGLIALAVFLPAARKHPDAPGARGLMLANTIVTWSLRGILAFIVFVLLLTMIIARMPAR